MRDVVVRNDVPIRVSIPDADCLVARSGTPSSNYVIEYPVVRAADRDAVATIFYQVVRDMNFFGTFMRGNGLLIDAYVRAVDDSYSSRHAIHFRAGSVCAVYTLFTVKNQPWRYLHAVAAVAHLDRLVVGRARFLAGPRRALVTALNLPADAVLQDKSARTWVDELHAIADERIVGPLDSQKRLSAPVECEVVECSVATEIDGEDFRALLRIPVVDSIIQCYGITTGDGVDPSEFAIPDVILAGVSQLRVEGGAGLACVLSRPYPYPLVR